MLYFLPTHLIPQTLGVFFGEHRTLRCSLSTRYLFLQSNRTQFDWGGRGVAGLSPREVWLGWAQADKKHGTLGTQHRANHGADHFLLFNRTTSMDFVESLTPQRPGPGAVTARACMPPAGVQIKASGRRGPGTQHPGHVTRTLAAGQWEQWGPQ